ncbi:recombinase family protein [Streptomyces californicus]|uniref:Recombinase family protein n=1 Tax=Streptomyces californicus TaxID=67351 RepID=A0ABX7J8F9_9ACTN|nr:recombinase family protein [Streptomyces californicus]QRV43857.1 recombinase family protein [Streptomyces californicus]
MDQKNTAALDIAMGVVDRVTHSVRLRAVAYARVSTEEQAKGYGVQSALKKITRYMGRKGMDYVGTYTDEGISGSLEAADREDLKRLMADAHRTPRPFDIVVVSEGRAIGRVGRAFWRWVWALEDIGVFVGVVEDDYDNSTAEGRKKMRRDADYAETEWETIRKRTQGGLQEKAEEGGWPGGMPPYGYEIACKGQKGKSHLVQCEAEVLVLKAMWGLVVEDGMNTNQLAERLNVLGLLTRSGVPWSATNARAKLLSESTLNARVIFRNPNRTRAGHGAKFGRDGKPLNGETVIIKLDPIFTPEEVAALKSAMGRLANGKPKSQPQAYPLSKRLFNEHTECNSHHVGMARTSRGGRWYRCTGLAAKYPGDTVCGCKMVDADAMESAVWGEVVNLLGDPDRLRAMAAEWVGMTEGDKVQHADRIADFDRQIADLDRAITTMVKDYAKAGLPASAVAAASAALIEERRQLTDIRDEAAQWLEETKATAQRARDLEALATMARTRLADMTPADQDDVLGLLDVRVTITGPVPKPKLGLACSLAEWFKEAGRKVPAELTDEAWALAEPVVKAWEPPNHKLIPGRLMLDAMFYKARTGCKWSDLPERFGLWKGIHSRYKTWRNCGVWDDVMAALPQEGPGYRPVPKLNLVPPFRVEGRVDPRVLTGADIQEEMVAPEAGVPGPATSGLSSGVHELLRGEGVLVTDADEVVELVGDMGELTPDRRGPVLPRDHLDASTARVLDALPYHGAARTRDLARAAGASTDETLGRLYELHSLGFVEREGDGWRLTPPRPSNDDARRGGT